MKILWVVNTVFPAVCSELGMAPPIYGGWMYGLAADLNSSGKVRLAIVTVYQGGVFKKLSNFGIDYYLIPSNQGQNSKVWDCVVSEFRPDLVHVHGTEYSYGMSLMRLHPELSYLVSIQGLVSVIHRYFLAGMSFGDIIRNITFRDIVRGDTLLHGKYKFYKRGRVERFYIKRANALIGRTDWDKAHIFAINPNADYFFCNESLRDEFYTDEKWTIANCRRYSIFLSQASYPIKGFHQILKALALLKEDYPDIVIEVAGDDITNSSSFMRRLKRNGYAKYINRLIERYALQKHIRFLGPLQAIEMKNAYLRANLFICPSSIENSPNSLGEAQVLGVPCVASYCGGIPSMVVDGETAILYRFEEDEMLAQVIRRLFESPRTLEALSSKGRCEALKRHNRVANLNALLRIYDSVISSKVNSGVLNLSK